MKKKAEKKQQSKAAFAREFSAGGVVFKRQGKKTCWLVGKHSGYHKWVLPKGLIEEGERGYETAVREVEEEMGVKAKVVDKKAIHKVTYFYWANFKDASDYKQSDEVDGRRRVKRYQESGGKKTKVFKVVSFFLMEYVSGDPKDHDWEMEEADWYLFEEAIDLLAFEGERDALAEARVHLRRNLPA